MFESAGGNYTGCCKKLLFFFTQYKMGGKEINFEDKKINKKEFYRNKKLFKIEDIHINKILVSKKNHMAQKILSNTLLDIMMMILLGHYA